jgi:hypothetical protein
MVVINEEVDFPRGAAQIDLNNERKSKRTMKLSAAASNRNHNKKKKKILSINKSTTEISEFAGIWTRKLSPQYIRAGLHAVGVVRQVIIELEYFAVSVICSDSR